MRARGNPPLSFYLLLLTCSTGTAEQDISTSVPAPKPTPVSGHAYSGESTSSFRTRSSSENVVTSAVMETTNQKDFNNTLGVTALLTPGNTHNEDKLSTTVPSSNYTHTGSMEPTTAVQHTSDVLGRLNTTAAINNITSVSTQPAIQHTYDTSEHPITTVLNYSRSASTQSTIEHTSNTFNRSTTTPLTANYSSRTESTMEQTSNLLDKPTTTPFTANHTSGIELTTTPQHTTNMSLHATTPASVNNTEHTSSIAVTDRNVQVSSISVNVTNENTTYLANSTISSFVSPTVFKTTFTQNPRISSTWESVTTQTKSTENNSNRTVSPTELANATFSTATVQSITSAGSLTGSSVSSSTLSAKTGTLSKNETTGEISWSTTKYVSLLPTLVTSTVDHTDYSKNSTSASVDPGTTPTTGSNDCRNVECPPFSYCVPGISSYSCVTGKIYPGELHLKSLHYTPDMADQQSIEYRNVTSAIVKNLKTILKKENGYIGSTVTKLLEGSVIAAIENIFQPSSIVTSTEIEKAIQNHISACHDCWPLTKADGYKEQDLCSINTCDASTTICTSKSGTFSCDCKEGFFKPFPSERSCTACTSGYKLENKTCVKCPFGYAGFNCDDSSLLAVVVISCVLGSLLLILLISLWIACNRSKAVAKESYEHETYLMWPKKDVPKIPRVTMNRDSSQVDFGSKNVLMDSEMSNGNTVNPEDSRREGDLKTFSNTDPSRYSYLSHGQANPYFVNEEK